MIISMSVAEVVSDLLKSESKIQVKWPNDVLIEQKKVCGILIENSLIGGKIGHSIIGVGLNVNQYNFLSPNATSMLHYYKEELSLPALLEKLVLRIENNYLQLKQGRFNMVKQCYLDRLYGYNAPIYLLTDHEFKGQIVDITSEGRVVILHEGGKSIFDFKELKFILA